MRWSSSSLPFSRVSGVCLFVWQRSWFHLSVSRRPFFLVTCLTLHMLLVFLLAYIASVLSHHIFSPCCSCIAPFLLIVSTIFSGVTVCIEVKTGEQTAEVVVRSENPAISKLAIRSVLEALQ